MKFIISALVLVLASLSLTAGPSSGGWAVKEADGNLQPEDTTARSCQMKQTPARFQGKEFATFREWVQEGLYYTLERTDTVGEGRVTAQFLVSEAGAVTQISVLQGLHPAIDSIIIARIAASPAWEPEIGYEGKNVPAHFTIPIHFRWDEAVFYRVEQMPVFQQGDLMTFWDWVHKNLPEELQTMDVHHSAFRPLVSLSFVIDKQGELTDINVLATTNSSMAGHVVETLKRSPRWTPGSHHGIPVDVKYTMPVLIGRR